MGWVYGGGAGGGWGRFGQSGFQAFGLLDFWTFGLLLSGGVIGRLCNPPPPSPNTEMDGSRWIFTDGTLLQGSPASHPMDGSWCSLAAWRMKRMWVYMSRPRCAVSMSVTALNGSPATARPFTPTTTSLICGGGVGGAQREVGERAEKKRERERGGGVSEQGLR